LDIAVELTSDGKISLDKYLSSGPQPDEDIADDNSDASDAFTPNPAALAALESMGFPQVRIEKALHATGNSDAEVAMNWIFEHMDDPDIDVPVALSDSSIVGVSDEHVDQLVAMGFAPAAAKAALKKNSSNVEQAIEWLFANPDAADDEVADVPYEVTVQQWGSTNLPVNYRLKAIICHKGGSVHAGHYVAFIRKEVGGSDQWVLFNDEKVVQGGEIDEMQKFAYVYFFERL
jgi:ubiquitin carboxyl-terminal hydrolase 5/13